jgi:hypothetical protein
MMDKLWAVLQEMRDTSAVKIRRVPSLDALGVTFFYRAIDEADGHALWGLEGAPAIDNQDVASDELGG